MKVALLKPPHGGILGLEMITFVEPLGLECVAGALIPEGHDCKVVDLRLDGMESGMAKAREFEPDVVGIQCNFTTERFRALKVAREVHRQIPKAKVVVGGHDASRDPDWFAQPEFDIIVIGDGEDIAPLMIRTLEEGGDLTKVPGLMLNTEGGTSFTGHAPMRGSLDDIPLPARHLIDEYAHEYYFNFHKPLALMETARGCPYRCNFCSVWKFHEGSFRTKSPERVVEELSSFDAPIVFFTDDIFWLNIKRGKEMARQIKAAGIKKRYKIQTRTDLICRHPELVEMWKECGHLSVFLGLEKVDDEGLKSVNKGNKAANNNRAIQILQDLDVGYTPNFIVDPSWQRDDFKRLRDWVEATGAYNSGFSILTPLPGTELWDEVGGQVNTTDWELFDIAHTVLPTKLPINDFYDEYARLWRHALEVRYKLCGKFTTYFTLGAALATRKVTVSALKKGMNFGKHFSRKETFLKGHRESIARTGPTKGASPAH